MSVIKAEGSGLDNRGEQSKWNSMMFLFILVSVLASIVIVCGVASLIFPDMGIPIFWVAFPVAPQPVPVPG